VKEISTASNIKDRVNRQLVSRLLRVIQVYITNHNIGDNGLILYAGVTDEDREVFFTFSPKIKLNMFYYNCGKTFIAERFSSLFQEVDGFIVFANGDVCHIYKFENTFIKLKTLSANLIKRQRKGGQSAVRFSRLAEESRHEYVIRVIDSLNLLCRGEESDEQKPCFLFGSNEITRMILERSELLVKVTDGGFLDFNDDTIKSTNTWLTYLKQNGKADDTMLKEIVYLLDTNVDMLDFDVSKKEDMKFCVTKEILNSQFQSSPYYCRLKAFDYIGVKYFTFVSEEF
jgi:hypothetical protein